MFFYTGSDLCKPEMKEYIATVNWLKIEKDKLSFAEIVDRKRTLQTKNVPNNHLFSDSGEHKTFHDWNKNMLIEAYNLKGKTC